MGGREGGGERERDRERVVMLLETVYCIMLYTLVLLLISVYIHALL